MLNLSFYITVLLLSLNQFTSVYKNGETNVYLFDFAVVFFALYGLFYFLLVEKSFKLPKFSILFLFLTATMTISLLMSIPNFPMENIVAASFYLVRWGVYLLASLVVYNMLDKKIISTEGVENTLIASGVLISVIGFIQLIFLPDFGVLSSELGWDPHRNRLASTFFDPNFAGAYLTICIAFLINRFFSRKGFKKIELVAFLTILLAIFLTFSRSTWAMFAIIILVYGIFKSKRLFIASLITFFVVYFAVPRIQTRLSGITDPADSASLRIVSWKNAMQIIKDNYWLGVGFNTYRYVQQDYGFLTPETENIHSGSGSDSSLLFIFATTGILGLFFYLLSIFYILTESFLKRNSGGLMVFAIVLGVLVESQFINSFFYPQILFALLVVFSRFSYT